MTPGIMLAKQSKIPHTIHEYSHDTACDSYGREASEKLGVEEERVFKTLVVSSDNSVFAVGIVPVSSMLNLKKMAKALGCKKVTLAEKHSVERITGYVLGGVSPLGQKKRLKTFLHTSAFDFDTIFVSAGKRGIEIELSPTDLLTLTNGNLATLADIEST